jgi:hypothetical protein
MWSLVFLIRSILFVFKPIDFFCIFAGGTDKTTTMRTNDYRLTEQDTRVKQYPDGKYRWVYEVNLLTNPTVLIDVWMVLAMSAAIVGIFMAGIGILAGDFDLDMLVSILKVGFIVLGLMTVLCIVGYLFYALLAKGKYAVLFIMDNKEVVHKKMPKSVKAAELIGKLAMFAGAGAGREGVVGTGLLAKTRTSLNSEYKDVRKVRGCRWMNLIKVEERFFKNRIYVNKEDFDFVFNYLADHCPQAKVKR